MNGNPSAAIRPASRTRRRVVIAAGRFAAGAAGFALATAFVPAWWCGRTAGAWFAAGAPEHAALARAVARDLDRVPDAKEFHTGDAVFNGEWLFGTHLMAGFGFLQLARERPDLRSWAMERAERCIVRLLEPRLRAFDTKSWGGDAIDGLGGSADHAAYLGYLNVLLGAHRSAVPDSRFTAVHDRITAHLARRLAASRIGLLQTYPGEVYPVDNCAVAASIALHDRVTGTDANAALLADWRRRLDQRWTDPESGLLFQAVHADDGRPLDAPRASGTTLGVYLLSFWDADLSHRLYRPVRANCAAAPLGFGAVREYPPRLRGKRGGRGLRGDIDSGPVVFGFGVSPTGFLLAGCRIHGDAEYFRRLWASAWLAGAPHRSGDRVSFVSGGPLGNAILFAMVTARPGGWAGEAAP